MNEINKANGYLKSDNRRLLTVLNDTTKKELVSKISYDAIINSGASNLTEYLQKLNQQNPEIPNFILDFYRSNGTTNNGKAKHTKVKDKTFLVEWKKPNNNAQLGESGSVNGAAPIVAPTEHSTHQNNNMMNTEPQNTQPINYGMNAVMEQQLTLRMKAGRYDEEKEKNQELKRKLAKLEQKNDDLHAELREAKTDLKTAEKFKEFELLKKDLDKKPFVDSETAQMALQVLGPVLSQVLSKGQPQVSAGLTGTEHLSQVKKALIQEIQSTSCTDEMANNLTSLYVVLLNNDPNVNAQLAAVINQYNNQ